MAKPQSQIINTVLGQMAVPTDISPSDAPCWMNHEEASAYASGYNACLEDVKKGLGA